MEGTGLMLRWSTHAKMGTLLDLLAGEEELVSIQEIGMGTLNTAIVNILVFLSHYQFTKSENNSVTNSNIPQKRLLSNRMRYLHLTDNL